jgi:GH35 family endo-1,4-beta-xylanase
MLMGNKSFLGLSSMFFVLVLMVWGGSSVAVFSEPLTAAEIQRFRDDLGVDLSATQQTNLAKIVKPDGVWPAWRSDAVARIEQYRKADLQVRVVDKNGLPVPGASVRIYQCTNAFRFGGLLNLYNWSDNKDGYREVVPKLFNAVGAQNALKPKITNKHSLLPAFFEWAQTNNLPVRGHLLIWPGSGSLPYRDPYKVQQALDALLDAQSQTNPPPSEAEIATLKTNLIDIVNFQISDWASKWPVYEWDVVNEPLEKHDIENALEDDEQMVHWFKLAETNTVLPECKLLINEYQIISAKSWKPPSNSWSFEARTQRYRTKIDRVIAGGGRIDRIGFQSRFKYGHVDPALVSDHLAYYETTYPNIELVGTEFEILDGGASNEFLRAQMTEELLTTYYSHPKVTGLNVWTFKSGVSNAMCDSSGNLKLNALVWYYLHRIRFSTDESRQTEVDGAVKVRGFKGDYQIEVEFDGQVYSSNLSLTHAQTNTIALSDLSISEHCYKGWIGRYPAMGSLSNRLDDADGDGVPNLAEYAMGSLPDDATSVPDSLRIALSAGEMRCIFPRRVDAVSRGLYYRLETTTNLFDDTSWATNGVVELGRRTLEDDRFEVVTNAFPGELLNHIFIRLRAEYR